MTDNLENDFLPQVSGNIQTSYLRDSRIEAVAGFSPKAPPNYVLFDFDGTLSLVREGWPQIMVPMMVESLQTTGSDESPDDLQKLCSGIVMELTGKQTIYQMIRLAEEIAKRGGKPLEPLAYKNEYHDRLMLHIRSRRESLRDGSTSPSELLVPGSIELLDGLQKKGVQIYLASGTDERYVREEVELLQLDSYFQGHVYGAQDDYKSFSKAQVIERILSHNQVDGASLLGFGDGYVEIQNVRDAGGTSVAVASDETHRSGEPDPWKRQRLLGAGAHVVVPDYRQATRLLDWLWCLQ